MATRAPKKQGNGLRSTKKKRRKYDNSSRAEKSGRTQQKIIETLVLLLVRNRGGEVAIEDIAKKAGITPRTIFRFFKDKKTLHQAMDTHLMNYVRIGNEQMQEMDFIGFAKNAYLLFDKHAALTSAYVLSPFGNEARKIFRKKLSQAMVEKIVEEKTLSLTKEKRLRLALITSLVNAKIWYDLRADFGFSGEDMQEALDWALTKLLDSV